MNVNHALSLNVSSASVPPTLHMTQGDSNSRSIVAALFSGASPFNIPAGTSVMVRFRKPDGTGGLYDTTESGSPVVFSGNTVTAPVAAQMISAPGVVVAQIEVYSAATEESQAYRLASFCFFVDVEKSAYPDDTIISSDYYNILSESIQQALQYSQISQSAAKDAEAWAVGQRGGVDVPSTDPAHNNSAKYWAQNAETINLATSRVTGTLPLSKGGTGATTIAGILSALGISDYITAQGETNGFTWRKWASGVAECWKLHTDTGVTIQTAWGSVFDSSAYGAIAYPSGLFTAAPCCTITPNGSPDGKTTLGLEIGNAGTAANTPQWNYTRGTANTSGQTINVAIYAIGKWK